MDRTLLLVSVMAANHNSAMLRRTALNLLLRETAAKGSTAAFTKGLRHRACLRQVLSRWSAIARAGPEAPTEQLCLCHNGGPSHGGRTMSVCKRTQCWATASGA